MSYKNFKYEIDGDVAVITWDVPGKSMNVMDDSVVHELDAVVDAYLGDDAVKGAVFVSGKRDLGGGVDLSMLAAAKQRAQASGGNPAQAMFEFVSGLHGIYRKIELGGGNPKSGTPGKPLVVATPGTALGGVYELMLAAHHRIAADNPKAKIGLPEVKVGLFPGAGGATRLPRMLGLMAAGEFLLKGKLLDPQRALKAGLVDAVVPADELLEAAKRWVREAPADAALKPWDRKGFRYPGGNAFHPKGFPMFMGGAVMANTATQGTMPNISAMMSAIYEGSLVSIDTALRIEARWFSKVLLDPRSAAMIRSLFLNKTALDKGAVRPKDVPDMSVKKIGVLGAGMMGAGIAYVAARAGIETVLMDRDQESASRGKQTIEALLDKGVARGRVTEQKKAEILGRIHATPEYEALQGADLVVEAVFEDPGIKADVIKKAEAQLEPTAIFASNTSTLPISGLAKNSVRPERFIGIHFFSPVDRMLLVEIIKGKQTGDEAVAKALDFVRQLRKTPIVVNDARFFYANRCVIPYLNEATTMMAEGVNPALVENAGRLMGMPVPPLQLQDETSLELGVRILKATRAQLGDAYVKTGADDALLTLVEGHGRLGRKAGKGVYDYDEKGRRTGLWAGLADCFTPLDDQPAVDEVKKRLILAQVLEAVRALEENVLMDIREGDVGAILGWGFMPWSGGPLSWIDLTGPAEVVGLCETLAAEHGDRFAAPALLREIAGKGETFYGRFGPGAA